VLVAWSIFFGLSFLASTKESMFVIINWKDTPTYSFLLQTAARQTHFLWGNLYFCKLIGQFTIFSLLERI
jgi:hypothetical protein